MARNVSLRSLEQVERQLLQQRLRRSSYDYDSDDFDAQDRLASIKIALESNPKVHELRRHAVVSSIAALQTYHRGFLKTAMLADSAMRLRGSALIGDKFSMKDALGFINAERISAEEIIAHAAPNNSIFDMIQWLSEIFNSDFKDLMKYAVPPKHRLATEEVPNIIDDVDDLIRRLSYTFELRHIFAHEAAPKLDISFEVAIDAVHAVRQWIAVTEGILWQTALIGEPYTQFEINMSAGKNLSISSSRLARAIIRVRCGLKGARRRAFRANHKKWKTSILEFGDMSFGALNGSMWPAIRAASIAKMYDSRAEILEEWAEYLELR